MSAAQQGTDSQRGFTLVELVMAIVIISLALLGAIQVIIVTTTHSGDAVVDRQALAIAEAYLEEILLKDFSDPGGGAESGRADYDDVGDYDGLSDSGARDQSGTAIPGLTDYTVTVSVVDAALGSVPSGHAKKVTVSVSHPNGINLSLAGYKTNY
jgi:MSHA pilin protein MshD